MFRGPDITPFHLVIMVVSQCNLKYRLSSRELFFDKLDHTKTHDSIFISNETEDTGPRVIGKVTAAQMTF